MKTSHTLLPGSSALALALWFGTAAQAEEWYPYTVEVWDPRSTCPARAPTWITCRWKRPARMGSLHSFPHMKDAYWLGVDYGVVAEARRRAFPLPWVEAGGYTELNTQISQIEDCVSAGADAVIIGAISYDGLNNLVGEIRAKDIPVIDVINGMSSTELSAKSLVSFGEMAQRRARSSPGSIPVAVTRSGRMVPRTGWSRLGRGGQRGLRGSNRGQRRGPGRHEIRRHRKGSAGQAGRGHARDTSGPRLHCRTAVTAEAAVPILRARGLSDKVKVISYYYTPGVDRGIARGQILAAPTDSAVIQGRIAIDQAVRILEGEDHVMHAGPALYVVTQENHGEFDPSSTLAPDGFRPVFTVE